MFASHINAIDIVMRNKMYSNFGAMKQNFFFAFETNNDIVIEKQHSTLTIIHIQIGKNGRRKFKHFMCLLSYYCNIETCEKKIQKYIEYRNTIF